MHQTAWRTRVLLAGLAVMAAAILAAATPVTAPALAAARTVPSSPQARGPWLAPWPAVGAMLVLTIHRGISADGPVLARVTLLCDPDGGTHPAPHQACDALRNVDGQVDRLPAGEYLCPLYYAPVTGTAVGQWHGRRIHYARTEHNRCLLARATSQLFAF